MKENININIETMKAIWVTPEVHRTLKQLALDENMPVHKMLARLINNFNIYKNETNNS
jgi:hypothetical protein